MILPHRERPGESKGRYPLGAMRKIVLFLSVAVIVRSGGGGPSPADAGRRATLAAPAGGALAEPKALPAHSFDLVMTTSTPAPLL